MYQKWDIYWKTKQNKSVRIHCSKDTTYYHILYMTAFSEERSFEDRNETDKLAIRQLQGWKQTDS